MENIEPSPALSTRWTGPGRLRTVLRRGGLVLLLAVVALAASAGIYYYRFYHHRTAQERANQIAHTVFVVTLRGQPVRVQLYQQAGARRQTAMLFTSGDGGWSPFCADVAAHVAATGVTVAGFDAKDYLTTFASSQDPVTPEELSRDYASLLDALAAQPGVDATRPVSLGGWSLGAGFSVLVATDPAIKPRVDRVLAISLPDLNELAWKPTDAVIYLTHGTPREKLFSVSDYLPRLGAETIMLNATDDDTSPLAAARALFDKAGGTKHFYAVKANGHHFEGGEAEFYRDLDTGLEQPAARL